MDSMNSVFDMAEDAGASIGNFADGFFACYRNYKTQNACRHLPTISIRRLLPIRASIVLTKTAAMFYSLGGVIACDDSQIYSE